MTRVFHSNGWRLSSSPERAMPLFMSDEELRLDTVLAEAEQTCALLEQVSANLASELAAGSDLAADLAELIEQRDTEIREKDGAIQRYHHKIEVSKKTYEQVSERARKLDEELTKLRTELGFLRSERDKAVLEADFARDRLNGYMAEIDHQRKEANSVSLRNAELMHLVVDYEKRRESADSMQALEENSRKLSMEVSILKHEKEILVKSERRSLDEVHDLTERVHRLQATIDTIHTTDEVQENTRSMERRNQQEYIKRLERDSAELKKEVQEQRDHVRVLTLDKKSVFDGCMKQVEDMRKELQNSCKASNDAASRAAVAEAKCSDLEAKLKSKTIIFRDGGHDNSSATEANDELFWQKEELKKYKEEAQANKSYMLQYKEIVSSNEAALKQMESAYQDYKTESEIAKRSLEDEIAKLRNNLSEMEKSYVMKCEETASAMEAKEKDITTLMNDIAILRSEATQKVARTENLEIELASSKSALDEQCKRWRSAHDNYERQVILQSETIQELTNTSRQLSSLQQEITILRQTADAQKAENDALRTFGEQEKIELVKEKDEALRKYNELNDQNRILHNRLEALHIRLAEQERGIAGMSSQRTDSHGEDDLHGIVSYLRRSKEIAETEISLLKQEKSRLQIELESALKSSKEAQDLLRSQADSARSSMFKDEEFKSLQLQVPFFLYYECAYRILHNRLEALHIRLAEQERGIAGMSSQRTDSHGEDDLHGIVSYLRRSKEIAETEISLLKQEKSRLQIELESALKSSKEAQDLLRSQADSARSSMFKDEEFKSLQLQVREINLLRESNIQLREENRHKNQRISELVENSRGVDLKTYETMKAELQNVKISSHCYMAKETPSVHPTDQLQLDAGHAPQIVQAAELLQVQRPEAQLSHSGGLHQVPPKDDKSPPTRCNASPPTTTVPVSFRHASTDRRAYRNITSIQKMVAKELLRLINYADMEELIHIKGIGDGRAKIIIKFRSESRFKSLNDVVERMQRNCTPFSKIENMIDGFSKIENILLHRRPRAGGGSNKSKSEINSENDE